MAGSREGGLKAAKTNQERHGKDFYKAVGKKGGTVSRGGGFAANPELAKQAGSIGGRTSNRTGVRNGEGKSRSVQRNNKGQFVAVNKPQSYTFADTPFGVQSVEEVRTDDEKEAARLDAKFTHTCPCNGKHGAIAVEWAILISVAITGAAALFVVFRT